MPCCPTCSQFKKIIIIINIYTGFEWDSIPGCILGTRHHLDPVYLLFFRRAYITTDLIVFISLYTAGVPISQKSSSTHPCIEAAKRRRVSPRSYRTMCLPSPRYSSSSFFCYIFILLIVYI